MNREHGWTDYQERLGRVIAYIHDHLDGPLELDRLAEVAHLSLYQWHRVYHALHGETIAATVPIADVARKCGYPNVQSFARRAGLSLPPGAQAHPPLLPFTLGGGPCAVLRHRGPYSTMRAAYQCLYGSWLVQSGPRSSRSAGVRGVPEQSAGHAAGQLADGHLSTLGGPRQS